MRFELIDRVLEHTPEKLVAVKSVTSAEEYLADHFPGFAVLPGVLMLEVMVQAAGLLLAKPGGDASNRPSGASGAGDLHGCSRRIDGQPLVLAEVRNVRYGQMVRPGQNLRVEVTLRGRDGDGWDIAGVGTVDEQVAVQGRFRLAPLNARA